MKGKEKCKILREIRQKVASDNDISLITNECSYNGECKGTCPKCEAEVRYLERELERKRRMGQFITIAGLAISSTIGMASCEVEGEEEPMPMERFHTDDAPEREVARREVVYRNLYSYAENHPVTLSETQKPDSAGYYHISFTVTPEGNTKDITYDEGDVLAAVFETFLKEVPQETLKGLTKEYRYNIVLHMKEDKVVIFDYLYW